MPHYPAKILVAAVLVVTIWVSPVACLKSEDRFNFLKDVPFKEGDVLQLLSGEVMVAIAENVLAYVADQKCWLSSTYVKVIDNPSAKSLRNKMARKIDPESKYFDIDRSIALIKRLIGKTLPYGYLHCNSKHYMEHIVWAIPRLKKKVKNCPLYREIHEVDLKGIAYDEKLYLMDSRNRTIYVNNLPRRVESYTPNFDREREIINRKAKDAPSSSGVKKHGYAGSSFHN